MTKIEKVIPDLRLPNKETLALGGVMKPYVEEEESKRIAQQVLSVDGIYVTSSESPMAYGDKTRQELLEEWEKRSESWIYLYGGWNNGATIEMNFCGSLPGNIPFNQRKVKDAREGLKNPNRARIYYDYLSQYDSLSGWKSLLEQKGIQVSDKEYEELTIGYLLTQVGGAPRRWTCMVSLPERDEPLLPPTSSTPFPGAEYGNGFIVSYIKPIFLEGKTEKSICNSTGSRAVDSIALANLIVRLRHDQQTAKEKYIEDAVRRFEEMERRGVKPPYTRADAERYASLFVETQEPIVEDIQRILSKYKEEEIEGFQYALNITSDRSLATAVYKVSKARPYCFVKTTEKGWEVAAGNPHF